MSTEFTPLPGGSGVTMLRCDGAQCVPRHTWVLPTDDPTVVVDMANEQNGSPVFFQVHGHEPQRVAHYCRSCYQQILNVASGPCPKSSHRFELNAAHQWECKDCHREAR